MSKKIVGLTHLDAVQGNKDERTSRTADTVSEKATQVDAEQRQKQLLAGELCLTEGNCGG
jgi:hypothetical protein